MKKILITGGCGFVGSNLGILIKEKYPSYTLIALDNLKRRGSELNITRLQKRDIQFIHGDIRNKEDLDGFKELDIIIDASAEPSVLAGLNENPDYLIHTNFNGTVNCLNLAKKLNAKFIFLSTSRIYPINQIEQINFQETTTRFQIASNQILEGVSTEGISENFPLVGYRSLYGATKLASELLINEYNQLLGLATLINRCGVLTGPYQMGKVDQGVVVLWVARHFWKKGLGYFGFGGEGKQLRDILHIKDLFELIDYQIHHFEQFNGQTFNVGGGKNVSTSLKELTMICEEVTGNKINIHKVKETRAADIRIFITDNQKINSISNWQPKLMPNQIIEDIFQWIRRNEKDLKPILY